MSRKLQLNKETLRHLSEEDLSKVSGGTETLKCQGMRPITEGLTQSPACPSGATWFTSCESNIGTCG
jgi:hypothetical protein